MINALALVGAAFYSGAARGAIIQTPLCAIGFLLGLAAWFETRALADALGALAMLAGIPWTIAVILPINRSLQRATPEAAGAATNALLQDWYRRHAVRTALGLLAVIAFFVAALNGSTLG